MSRARGFTVLATVIAAPLAIAAACVGGRRAEADGTTTPRTASNEPPATRASLRSTTGAARCPSHMALIADRFCIDRYEGSLVEIVGAGAGAGAGEAGRPGREAPFSPFEKVEGHVVKAVSQPNVFPQGYISGLQAEDACARAGKRLCTSDEWRAACVGPKTHTYGYGDTRERGRCNDAGRSPMLEIWHVTSSSPKEAWSPLKMNDPRLNQLPGSLAKTGTHPRCTNGYGVFDMVGNLHEWVDDPNGTFQGGYYLDTTINGEGCQYATTAHGKGYHDYSTGFRCCAGLPEGADGGD